MSILRARWTRIAALVFALSCLHEAFGQEVTTWVDKTGKHRTEAEFVRLDGDNVVIRNNAGKEVRVALKDLSSESQQKAKDAAKAIAKAPPKREVPKATDSGKSSSKSSSKPSERGPLPPPIDFPTNTTVEKFAEIVIGELQKENPTIAWDLLPPSYQKDVEALASQAVAKMDPQLFTTIRKTLDNIVDLLRKKKDFILNCKQLKQAAASGGGFEKSYDPAVDLIEAYIGGDILDPARLSEGNFRELIGHHLANISVKAKILAETIPDGFPLKDQMRGGLPPDFKYEIKKSSGQEATISFKAPQGDVDIELMSIEGRWLPKEMVQQWSTGIGRAKSQIDMITPEMAKQMKDQVSTIMAFSVTPIVSSLKNAGTQQEFDEALDGIVQSLSAMIPPGMGPPGFGPPGNPPPGNAPPGFGPPGFGPQN